MTRVAIVRVDHGSIVDDDRGVVWWSVAQQERLASLRDVNSRRRFIAGRRALHSAVARLLGIDPRDVEIDSRCPDCGLEHGRPIVLNPDGAWVSLTHACGIAIAVASRAPVGVDAESPTVSVDRREAARELTRAGAGNALVHWTRVEAVLKADGRGLRVVPASVTIRRRTGWVDDLPDVRYRVGSLRVPGVIGSLAVRA